MRILANISSCFYKTTQHDTLPFEVISSRLLIHNKARTHTHRDALIDHQSQVTQAHTTHHSSGSRPASISLLFVLADDEPAVAGVDGGDEEEEDVEDDERLDLVDGHPRLDVELRQRALPRDDLADDGEGHAQLRQPPHEQLVRLGEPKQRPCIACTEGTTLYKKNVQIDQQTRDRCEMPTRCMYTTWCREYIFSFLHTSLAEAEGAAEALAGLDDGLVEAGDLLVDEATAVPESPDGAKEGEEDEEQEEGLRLVDGDSRLQVQLGKDALPGDGLSK